MQNAVYKIMLALYLVFIGLLAPTWVLAQKNVVPVNQTQLLQLQLPAGSKQDKRLISTGAAKLLLETEAKKAGSRVTHAEVYYLPGTGSSGYSSDSLVGSLLGKGIQIAPVASDTKFAWAQSEGKLYMLYFETQPKETNLYIGACSGGNLPLQQPQVSTPALPDVTINTGTSQQQLPAAPEPPAAIPPTGTQPTDPSGGTHNAAPVTNTNSGGFYYTTANFDDGWSSTELPHWVQVRKNNLEVLLHYGIPFDDEMRNNALLVCWNRKAAGRYRVINQKIFEKQTFDIPFYYMEADVQDLASGQNLYVGFKVVAHKGIAYCMEVRAPNSSTLHATFPTHQSIEGMYAYNSFPIHVSDLTGTWSSSGASAVQLYNVYTGSNAGMNFVSSSDEFQFNANGTYRSKHMAAIGNYGNTTFGNSEYKGNLIVGKWEISLTNRHNNKTEDFHAFFEAVQGGRILHLTNKQFSGLTYKLVKVK